MPVVCLRQASGEHRMDFKLTHCLLIARLDLFRFCHIMTGSIYGIEQ
jgi:hypothetical protein